MEDLRDHPSNGARSIREGQGYRHFELMGVLGKRMTTGSTGFIGSDKLETKGSVRHTARGNRAGQSALNGSANAAF